MAARRPRGPGRLRPGGLVAACGDETGHLSGYPAAPGPAARRPGETGGGGQPQGVAAGHRHVQAVLTARSRRREDRAGPGVGGSAPGHHGRHPPLPAELEHRSQAERVGGTDDHQIRGEATGAVILHELPGPARSFGGGVVGQLRDDGARDTPQSLGDVDRQTSRPHDGDGSRRPGAQQAEPVQGVGQGGRKGALGEAIGAQAAQQVGAAVGGQKPQTVRHLHDIAVEKSRASDDCHGAMVAVVAIRTPESADDGQHIGRNGQHFCDPGNTWDNTLGISCADPVKTVQPRGPAATGGPPTRPTCLPNCQTLGP
ncbi:hypothetical protein PACID_20030 [Acidipropionibacterium acidipropionici ATCC 4875]|uniref:Uncharacterized protein n=1 Tax=Acidipropionibacterium acidipropionici (strain ATCC 4875 / DSM 20272 / JCM 6432 / NBRC 12425 / NCIMB 8070 / 4) TaxID=1171373 RepID=K7RXW0_ACIA4|nr:hypothetical protein PACID_20030 [Acidipropionibacterium acidipropionici ATCC 4875]